MGCMKDNPLEKLMKKQYDLLENAVWRYAYLINLIDNKELDEAIRLKRIATKDVVVQDKEDFSNLIKCGVDGLPHWDHDEAVMFVMAVSRMEKHLCDTAVIFHKYSYMKSTDYVFRGQLNKLQGEGFESFDEKKRIEEAILIKKAQLEKYLSQLTPEMYSNIEVAINHYSDLHLDLIGYKDDESIEPSDQDKAEFLEYFGAEVDEDDVSDIDKAVNFMVKRWGVVYAGCIAKIWLNRFNYLSYPTVRDAYLDAINELDHFEKEHGAVFSAICF